VKGRAYLLAEFGHATPFVAAARALSADGVVIADAFTPFPLPDLDRYLVRAPSRVPWITGAGAVVGALTGYLMQWYSAVIDYPIDVGGRPTNSWPSFLPVTFELAVLFGAFAAFFGMLALNGLPRLHHPLFAAERFSLATRDRFFLYVPLDKGSDEAALAHRLHDLGALHTQAIVE
jgi:hypothetical protein